MQKTKHWYIIRSGGLQLLQRYSSTPGLVASVGRPESGVGHKSQVLQKKSTATQPSHAPSMSTASLTRTDIFGLEQSMYHQYHETRRRGCLFRHCSQFRVKFSVPPAASRASSPIFRYFAHQVQHLYLAAYLNIRAMISPTHDPVSPFSAFYFTMYVFRTGSHSTACALATVIWTGRGRRKGKGSCFGLTCAANGLENA